VSRKSVISYYYYYGTDNNMTAMELSVPESFSAGAMLQHCLVT